MDACFLDERPTRQGMHSNQFLFFSVLFFLPLPLPLSSGRQACQADNKNTRRHDRSRYARCLLSFLPPPPPPSPFLVRHERMDTVIAGKALLRTHRRLLPQQSSRAFHGEGPVYLPHPFYFFCARFELPSIWLQPSTSSSSSSQPPPPAGTWLAGIFYRIYISASALRYHSSPTFVAFLARCDIL